MEQSDRRSSLPRLPWIRWGCGASPNISRYDTDNRDFRHHERLQNLNTLVVFLHKPHLNRLHALPGAPPLVFLLHDYLTQRQVWPLTSALSKLLKHPSNKPHLYHSSIAVVEYLCIYLCTIFRSLFIIVYLFMYLFIYCFGFFTLCVMDSELPLNFKDAAL